MLLKSLLTRLLHSADVNDTFTLYSAFIIMSVRITEDVLRNITLFFIKTFRLILVEKCDAHFKENPTLSGCFVFFFSKFRVRNF